MTEFRRFPNVLIVLPRRTRKLPRDMERFLLELAQNREANISFSEIEIPGKKFVFLPEIIRISIAVEQIALFLFSKTTIADSGRTIQFFNRVTKRVFSNQDIDWADLVLDFSNLLDSELDTPVVRADSLALYNNRNLKNVIFSVLRRDDFTSGSIILRDSGVKEIRNLKFEIMTRKYISTNWQCIRAVEFGLLRQLVNDLDFLRKFVTHDSSNLIDIPQRIPFRKFLNYYQFSILLFFKNRLKKILRKSSNWQIKIFDQRNDSTGIWNQIKSKTNSGDFCADPFLWEFDGNMYCFFEYFDAHLGLGKISYTCLDGPARGEISDAIIEVFHMSFPFLFEYNGETYLCPETSAANEIRIYKCIEFPSNWEFVKTIMPNISAADTVLFEHEGLWWLFTNIDLGNVNDHSIFLSAFYSNSPLSTSWTPHSNNPIKMSARSSRNAGLLKSADSIFRGGQTQGFNTYGKSASWYEILKLNKFEYLEGEPAIPNIISDLDLHQFHHIDMKNKVLAFDCLAEENSHND